MQFFSEISKLRNKCYVVFCRFHFFPMHERIVCLATLGGIINEWVHEEWMISSSFCRSVGQVQVRSGQVRSANSSGEGQKETWLLEKEIKEMRRGRGMT